jgi:hypothetical protein
MANGSSVRECRIAWIQQKRIGVTFVADPGGPLDDLAETDVGEQ